MLTKAQKQIVQTNAETMLKQMHPNIDEAWIFVNRDRVNQFVGGIAAGVESFLNDLFDEPQRKA